MSTEPMDAETLHQIADHLLSEAPVEPALLRRFAQGYLALEEKLDGILERGARRGRWPKPPITEDGRLVASVLEHMRVGRTKYTLTELAGDCNVDRAVLSRCNSAKKAVKLTETLKTTLLWLIGDET